MQKEKWTLWKTPLVFFLAGSIPFIIRAWEQDISYQNPIAAFIGGLVGSMIGFAAFGFIVVIVRNRFFR